MTTDDRCITCKTGIRAAKSLYCRACLDRAEARRTTEQTKQWDQIASDNHRMSQWTLKTFPADDTAGKAALQAIKPWLWARAHHDFINGDFVEISDTDTDVYPDDHPIWEWFHGENYGLGIYIHGGVGSGKTGLAWSILRARVELEYDYEAPHEYPQWANVVELLDKARAAMSAGDRQSPIRNLYDASVVVLDDLGAERPTEWARDAIAALVQHRHTRELPTIVTSNYAPSQLAQRLGHDDPVIGQRIVSRLTDNCIKVKLDRADLRLKHSPLRAA